MNRKEILKRLDNYGFVPGHGPDYENMTNEELLDYLDQLETLFEVYFPEKDKAGD